METAKEKEAMATFMGFMKADHYTEDIPIYILPRYSPYEDLLKDGLLVAETLPEDMLFDVSWDWLMPIVRKIIEISCNEDESAFLSDEYTSVLDTVPLAIIGSSYKVVMEFINWYNKHKQ